MLTLSFDTGSDAPHGDSGRLVRTWRDDRGVLLARAYVRHQLRWIDAESFGVFAFEAGSPQVRVWPRPESSHDRVVRYFENWLQPVALQALGWQTLHASGALGESGAVLFCGDGGAGKSTLAYALRQRGWAQLADDSVVLTTERRRVLAHALPFTPRFLDPSFYHFATPAGQLSHGRSTFDRDAYPVAAILCLRQDPSAPTPVVEPIPLSEAFATLLRHANHFDADDPEETRRVAEGYLNVAETVPMFTLRFRPDFRELQRVAETVVRLMTTAGHGGPRAADLSLTRS